MVSSRERTLKTLHDAATDIQSCDSVEAACERTVRAAERVLEFDMCTIVLHDDGWLEPVAVSSGAPPGGSRRMAADQGLAGKTFQTGESYVVDSVEPDDDTDPAKDIYHSGMSVPVGEAGVFQATATERAAFSESDLEFTELLVAHTAEAIDRIRFQEELQESRDRLERQNERLEKFVDVVSHDIRNPLNVARGQLDLARADCESERLARVDRAHERMEVLIGELLTLARTGRTVEDPKPVDLGTVAEQCWHNVASGSATLVVEADRSVRADPGRLKRLLENLFRNAVEHGGGAPQVHARDDREPDLADGAELTVAMGPLPDGFYVADDGPGIPESERRDVFDPGFTTAEGGTGLGLNIVAEIVDAHDWTIAVTESESGGARFEVTGVEE
jgi:two-component system OmpR family sensor kinase